jgi:WD40 repeat protein
VERGLGSLSAAKLTTVVAVVLAFVITATGTAFQQASGTLTSSATNNEGAEVTRLPMQPGDDDDLPAGAVARLGTLRYRSGGMIAQMVLSPDGKTVVSQGAYGVSLMDAATGRETGRFPAGEFLPRRSATLSPDGRWLAVAPGRKDGLIGDIALQLWDCHTGMMTRELGKARYSGVRFAPDGKTLAALRFDSVVEIWNPHAGRLIQSWKADEDKAYDLFFAARFTAGGKWLVTRNKAQLVRCWEVATGRRLWELKDTHTNTLFFDAAAHGEVVALDATEYRAQVAAGGGETVEAHISLVDAGTGRELRRLVAVQKKNILGMASWFVGSAFTPDGKLLATSGQDGLIRLWDTETGKQLRTWRFHSAVPGALGFGPDGKTLAIADTGSQVRLLNREDGSEVAQPAGNQSGHYQAQFSADGKSVLTMSIGATERRWDAATGKLLSGRQWPTDKVAMSALAPDGKTLFSWGSDQPVRQWDIATGTELNTWPGDYRPRYPMSLLPSPDGQRLALIFQKPELDVLDTATGKQLCRLAGHAPWPFSGAFAPDGRRLITWGADARVRVWDLATGRQLREIAVGGTDIERGAIAPRGGSLSVVIYAAAVSPDGRLLALAVPNRSLVIHDVASGGEVRRFDQLSEDVNDVRFAPDGRTLAWWSRSGTTVHWLEVAGTGDRRQFSGHRGQITGVAFANDGRRLLTTSEDTTSLIWDLMGDSRPVRMTPDDLAACWTDLGADTGKAWPAIRKLAAVPEQSVAFLRGRLPAAPATDEKRIAALIADLNSDQFAVRKKATEDLEKLGEAAIDACRQALEAGPTAEARSRLTNVLETLTKDEWNLTPEKRRAIRAVEVLELIGNQGARGLLEELAKGAGGNRRTREARAALERLTVGR